MKPIDPLISEPEPYKLNDQPRSRYPLTAKRVGLIVRAGFVIGFVMGMGLAGALVHFLTQ